MKLSENLKNIRKENGLSQEDFAEKLGVSRQAVSKWESGQSYPEMEKILMICKLYNYNIDELINEKVNKINNKESVAKDVLVKIINWVTKLINLFLSMSLRSKIKFIIEQVIYLLMFYMIFMITPSIFDLLYFEIVNYNSVVLVFLGRILSGILKVIIICILCFVYYSILNSRYVKYALFESEVKKDAIINNKNISSKIIIRDEGDSKFSVINLLVNICMFFIKSVLVIFLLTLILIFILTVISLVLIVPLISNLLLFISLFLILAGAFIFLIILIINIYNFLLNIKNNKTLFLYTSLTSLIVVGIGTGLLILSISKFEEINDDSVYSKNVAIESVNIENLGEIVIYNSKNIEYITNENDEITFTFECSETTNINLRTYNSFDENNKTVVVDSYFNLDGKDMFSLVYDNLKNSTITVYDNNYNLTITANNDNIEVIKDLIEKGNY